MTTKKENARESITGSGNPVVGVATEMKDSEFMTANEKKIVLKQWEKFLKNGLTEENFTKKLYNHLIQHCSFIAHYDQYGFYATYFQDPEQSKKFLEQFDKDFGCVSAEYRETWWLDGEYEDINSEMCRIADKYKRGLYERLKNSVRNRDIETAKRLLKKHEISIDWKEE